MIRPVAPVRRRPLLPAGAARLVFALLILLLTSAPGAQDAAAGTLDAAASLTAPAPPEAPTAAMIIWTLTGAALVFFMQAGFAMVEAGFVRSKNACNIIMKNTMDFCTGSIVFFFAGFALMFGATDNGLWGASMFGLATLPPDLHEGWVTTFFVFQVVFAATSATIVSGAMAERTHFGGYLVYSALICLFVYPIFGKWAWGSLLLGDAGAGWLEGAGFHDFAGSTVVHSIGGWAALAGALVVGPRLGKFGRDGRPRAIPGHSIPLAALGVFILFFGWFGFNAGSTTDGANPEAARIALATLLAGSGGALGAMITSWLVFRKPDTGITLNGVLAGLVGITAGCDVIHLPMAIVVGLVSGALVFGAVLFIERVLKIDDPVGAASVHGVCGAWGTLAVAVPGFAPEGAADLGVQALGVVCALGWSFLVSGVIFLALYQAGILRVDAETEELGLDIAEHGNEAYPEVGWSSGVGSGMPMSMGAGAAAAAPVAAPRPRG